MPPSVSVLVPTRNPSNVIFALVTSIDTQSVASAEFETVYADWGSSDGTLQRLQQLAASRPNVRVETGASSSSDHELMRLALEGAVGEYVFVVQPSERLLPRALEHLLAFAREHGADVVAARTLSGSGSDVALLPVDRPRLLGDDLRRALAVPALLVRRELLLELDVLPGDPGFVDALLAKTALVAGYAAYPVLLTADGDLPHEPGAVVAQSRLAWDGRGLRITATAEVDTTGIDLADARLAVVVSNAVTHEEYALATTVEPLEGGASGWALAAVLEPQTAALGDPLDAGQWRVLGRLAVADRELVVTLHGALDSSAVLDGDLFVLTSDRAGATLDVGATAHGLQAEVGLDDAEMVESSRGSMLRLALPHVHVQGAEPVAGHLVLGSFPLPANLLTETSPATLECYVSGLAGTSALSVHLGARRTPTGLSLVISPDGENTVVTTPPPPAPAKPKPARPAKSTPAKATTKTPAKKAAKKPAAPAPAAPSSAIKRIRRHVPRSLEPGVKKLARVGPARRLYQKLTRV